MHSFQHSKNVLLEDDFTVVIADLGLAKNESSLSRPSNHGMLRYKDSQCFINPHYVRSYKSDIFSLGMLLWEISTGRVPWSQSDDTQIPNLMRQRIREGPEGGAPFKYIRLYERCWDQNPQNRPDINLVYKQLEKIDLNTCEYYFKPEEAPDGMS